MSDMIKVRRANVVLRIDKHQQAEYLSKGFDVVDENGKVVTEATASNDVSVLHQKLAEAQKKIKSLEAENEKLKKQLQAAPEETLEDDFDEIDDVEEVPEEKPRRRNSKKDK